MKTERVLRITPSLRLFRGMPTLVPFISVFFILLIFFMMGANFVPVQGIPVELPQAGAKTAYVSRNLILTVDQNSNLYFNDQLTGDFEQLQRLILDAMTQTTPSADKTLRDRLIIRFDVRAASQTLFKIMNLAAELNLETTIMSRQAEHSAAPDFGDSDR